MSARAISTLIVAVLLGCDSAPEGPPAPTPAAAKAKLDEADLARRKAEREAAKLAEENRAKEIIETIDKITALPEKLPPKLDKACDAVAEAQDAFVAKSFEPEDLAKWNAGKSTQLALMKKTCVEAGSIPIAACQKNALDSAPKDMGRELPNILSKCIEKFGGAAAGPG